MHLVNLWDLWTLRHLAGLSQARAAELAGVSRRTWRRWERGETTAPAVVFRWLRLESGHPPGWPEHIRCERAGVRVWTGAVRNHLLTPARLEAFPWLVSQLSGPARDAWYGRSSSAS